MSEFIRGPVPHEEECQGCPLFREEAHQPVRGEGLRSPKLVIIGEGPGTTEVRHDRPFCLAPDTPVLMADLTWKPIGDVVVGDKILSVDEFSGGGWGAACGKSARAWRVAEVTATKRRVGEITRVVTDCGDLRGSADHRVLVRRGGHADGSSGGGHWLAIGKLQTGKERCSRIVYIGAPWQKRFDYAAAWLAGFMDGEGHVLGSKSVDSPRKRRHAQVGFSQNLGPTYDRACAMVESLGYALRARDESKHNGVICGRVLIRGALTETMRFLGEVRPERLVADFQRVVDGKRVRGLTAAHVKRREIVGRGELVDITTTCGTFIANGFVVHNCGPSGHMLWKAAAYSGLDRKDVYVTNTTLCYPDTRHLRTFGMSKDTAVSRAAEHCRARLMRELKALPAVPILAVGKPAAQALLEDNKFKITEMAGATFTKDLKHEYAKGNKKLKISVGERQIVPTIHPAAILRGGDGNTGSHAMDLEFWNLTYHVGKVRGMTDGTVKPWKAEVKIEVKDSREAQGLLEFIAQKIRRHGAFAYDTETRPVPKEECDRCRDCDGHSALEPMHARITAIGLATAEVGVSVAWDILTLPSREIVRKLLADPKLEKIIHNRGYDEVVSAQHDMPIAEPIFCTMLAHHNAFPGLAHKLQKVVCQFLPAPPWKAEFRHGKGSDEERAVYNATDALSTMRVKPALQVCIKRTDAERTFESDSAMQRICNEMQVTGIPISLEANRILAEYLGPKIEEHRESLISRVVDAEVRERFLNYLATEQAKRRRKEDSDDFYERYAERREEAEEEWEGLNLNAKDQVVALLKASGVPLTQRTKKGSISTKKDVLERLITHPAVHDLLSFRAVDKLKGTFVDPLPGMLDKEDRAHVVWSPNKITGRWGSTSMGRGRRVAWQNWAKDKKVEWPCLCSHLAGTHGPTCSSCACQKYKNVPKTLENWCELPYEHCGMPNLRWQVVAPPGRILIGGDFAQLEAREIALASLDPFLCDAFASGEDIHAYFAAEIFGEMFTGIPVKSPAWVQMRDITKRLEYGYFYGAAPTTAWNSVQKEGYKVSLQTIIRAFGVFAKKMPNIPRYHAALAAVAARDKRIRSFVLGRSRWFPAGMADPNTVKNFVIQSSGADIMNLGLAEFWKRKPKNCFGLIQGHDSFTVEADEDDGEKVKQLMVECFEREITNKHVTMRFPFEVEIGPSWAVT